MKTCSILFLLLMILSTPTICQTVPIGAMPMHYNSSFAGSAGDSRISSYVAFSSRKNDASSYRNLIFQTSHDRFYPGIRSGIGITIHGSSSLNEYKWSNTPNKNIYSLYGINLDFASKISIKGKYTLSPALGLRYGFFNINSASENPGFEN